MNAALFLVYLVAGAVTDAPGLARSEALALRGVTPNAAEVACYGRFELTLDLVATYDNPFDPGDIDVYAEFTSPKGDTRRVNGFFTQTCERTLENGAERIVAMGQPFWQVRFAPDCEGAWRYRVFVKDRTGRVESPEAAFTVTPSASPGYLRRNARSPHIFAFDNGQPFVAIGENMCWGGGRGSFDYDDWLPALSKAGGNWIRLWMIRWNCGIEWSAEDQQTQGGGMDKAVLSPDGQQKTTPPYPWHTFSGLGVYNLCNAWKLDTILDTAERNGVQVMLCLGTYGEFTTGGFFNEGMWATNPYNAAMGGPCEKPDDFWTNEKARAFYQRRLRYIAARYGWRPNLFAWEFWNEAYPPAAWVAEMAQFLKGKGPFEDKPADPFGHLVSTTYGKPEVWELPDVDFTMSHHYGEANIPDEAPITHDDARNHTKYGKPHFMAEFGIDWRSSDDKCDPKYLGINLHNGLWSSIFSGNAGTGMIWYWDGYVHPGNLYAQFTAIRQFTDRIPWNEGPWTPLKIDPPRIHLEQETWHDLALAPSATWGKNTVAEFTITPFEGTGGQPLPTFLFGPYKPDLRTPLVLRVNYEHPGRFILKVGSVSGMARFQILLDGQVARDVSLSASPPPEGVAPEYETTRLRPEYNSYEARFNKDYAIDVPTGARTITIDATEGDWLSAASYTFAGYVSDSFPKVNVYGITNGARAYLWAQNAEHNWLNVNKGTTILSIPESTTTVHGLAAGTYTCEWWDTWKNEAVKKETAACAGGNLPVAIPELEKDLAASMQP